MLLIFFQHHVGWIARLVSAELTRDRLLRCWRGRAMVVSLALCIGLNRSELHHEGPSTSTQRPSEIFANLPHYLVGVVVLLIDFDVDHRNGEMAVEPQYCLSIGF